MTWLLAGIFLFVVLHLSSSVVPSLRDALRGRLRPNGYRALFSVLALGALALIVAGWQRTVPNLLYVPPAWGFTLALPLMFFAVVLFGASHGKTGLKRIVRHPQLMAVAVWSVAHLLANGDSRSVTLFASLGAWAILEMLMINRREGEWIKPYRASIKGEAITIGVSAVIFLVLFALHPYFTGVSPI